MADLKITQLASGGAAQDNDLLLISRTVSGAGSSLNMTAANIAALRKPAGNTTELQFNDTNAFAGSTDLTFNKNTNTLSTANLTVTSKTNLGAVENVTIIGGTNGQVLTTNGAGVLSFTTVTSGTSSSISNGTSNVSIATSGGTVTVSVNNTSNVLLVSSTGIAVNGTTSTLGDSTAPAGVTITGQLISSNTSSSTPLLTIRKSASAGNPIIAQMTSSGSAASPTIVAAGRVIGRNSWYAYDGANYIEAAAISCQVDNDPGLNDMPGRITFLTTVDGQSSPTERMRITNSGNIGIGNTAPVHKLSITGTLNVSGDANLGNLGTAQVLASTSVTAPQLISNVVVGTAPLSVTSTTRVANLNVASAETADTVTTNAQPNITSVGTLTSLTVSGTTNFTGTLSLKRYTETVVAGGTVSGTLTPDAAAGSIYTYTLNGNITLNSLANVSSGTSMTIILTQDSTGNRVLTSTMKFTNGLKVLSTAANAIDIISVFYDGSTYYASLTQGYA